MAEQDIVDAYLDGKIAAWTCVRRLMKLGLSVGTAVAFTAMLPAVAHSGDVKPLEELIARTASQKPDESIVLERLMAHVARGLVRIEEGGPDSHLRRSLVMLSMNAAQFTVNDAKLSFNGNVRTVPVNIEGNLNQFRQEPGPNVASVAAGGVGAQEQNFALTLGGNLGQVPVNLNGFIHVNVNGQRGPRGVNLNVSGNVGEMPVNLSSDIKRDQ